MCVRQRRQLGVRRRATCGALSPPSSRVEQSRPPPGRAPPGRAPHPAGAIEGGPIEPALDDLAVRRARGRAGAFRPQAATSWTWPKLARRARAGVTTGGRAGAAGEDRGREAQPLVAGQLHLAELVADHELVGLVELRLAHERLDVEPVAEVRGHAAGTRVRVRAAGRAPRARPWRRGPWRSDHRAARSGRAVPSIRPASR